MARTLLARSIRAVLLDVDSVAHGERLLMAVHSIGELMIHAHWPILGPDPMLTPVAWEKL